MFKKIVRSVRFEVVLFRFGRPERPKQISPGQNEAAIAAQFRPFSNHREGILWPDS
jgi:hypothetical protein